MTNMKSNKMILISHRGNVLGPDPLNENKPECILECIKQGFEVEIDVWFQDSFLYLGHDQAKYKIQPDFLKDNKEKLWCHAKNSSALSWLVSNSLHCFWHQKDEYTITSKGFIWCYPASEILEGSIALFPETTNLSCDKAIGICSDYIGIYKI